jgi:hypothetical protein
MVPVDELIQSLGQAPALIVPMIRQADPSVLRRRPPSGKWSIHEHACHLAQGIPCSSSASI